MGGIGTGRTEGKRGRLTPVRIRVSSGPGHASSTSWRSAFDIIFVSVRGLLSCPFSSLSCHRCTSCLSSFAPRGRVWKAHVPRVSPVGLCRAPEAGAEAPLISQFAETARTRGPASGGCRAGPVRRRHGVATGSPAVSDICQSARVFESASLMDFRVVPLLFPSSSTSFTFTNYTHFSSE